MAERLKVYFGCAIRGEQGGLEEKVFIVKTISRLGHLVLSETFVGMDLNNNQTTNGKTPTQVYRQDINWLDESDVVVADVSRISSGLGFELGWKVRGGGRAVALCREDKYEGLSNMLKGCDEPNYSLHIWKDFKNLRNILKQQLGKVD
jgi:2'-deoxynucleoside 5'-phosphate N-hydrolase